VSRALAWVRARPLARRIAGYGAGSIVAAATSELAFAATLYFGHTGTAAASAAGFVGGAIPNYFLNRRWAWTDRRGRSRRTEVLLYTVVAVASFVASVVVTGYVEHWARHQTADRRWSVLLAAAAYLAVSGAFFAVKFVLYELVVFKEAGGPEAPAPPPGAAPTMSTR
jgi:putative flippase GtrA